MRIDELQLRAFGPFTDLTITFPALANDFHVIYGPNEAGKSSALRALKSLLFGIPHQSADTFLHEGGKLRIGGLLSGANNNRITLIRRKGLKNDLLDMEEKPIDGSVLSPFLQGVTAEMFEVFFGISHDTLASGGQNILKEGGSTGQSLFSAGMGGINLRAVLNNLNSEADSLFRQRGSNQVINQAIKEHDNIRKEIQGASITGKTWIELTDKIKKIESEIENLAKKIGRTRQKKSRLERIRQALPDTVLLSKRKEELAEMGVVITVEDDFSARRKESLEKLRAAREVQERAMSSIERLKEKIGSIIIPPGILDQGEAISELHERWGGIRKGLHDMKGIEGNIQQLAQDMADIASKTGATIKEHPGAALRAKIQDLGSKREAIRDALTRSTKDINKTVTELAITRKELEALGAARDAGALKSAVFHAQRQGDMAHDLKDAEGNLRAVTGQIALGLERLPLWSGSIEELQKVSVPALETIDRFESSFQKIAAKSTALDEKTAEIRTELDKMNLTMETLRSAGELPSEGDLAQAREKREAGWSLVVRSWIGGNTVEEEAAAFDPENPLREAYEKTVVHADDVADRLRREADRVARFAELSARLAAGDEALATIEKSRKELAGSLSELEGDWNRQWESAHIAPLPPKEMRSWLGRQSELLQKVERARELGRTLEERRDRMEEHRARLSACLNDIGKAPPEDSPYDSLLAFCQDIVTAIEDENNRRKTLGEKTQKLEEELKAHRESRKILEQEHDSWQTGWKDAVFKLDLDGDVSPVEVYAVLSKIDEYFKKAGEKDSFEKRVTSIKRDAAEFRTDAESLVKLVSPELAGGPLEQAVPQLNNLLGKAKTDSALQAEMKKRLREDEEELYGADMTIKTMTGRLDSLCEQTGCTEHSGLEEIEIRSAKKKALEQEIDSIEERLIATGGGMTVEEIIEAVAGVDTDALPSTIQGIAETLERLEGARSELDQQLGGMRVHHEEMDGKDTAAEKAQQAQQILSSIRDNVEHYARLRMCSIVLNREIERYRSENQDPLLERAGQLFSALTLQSFVRLETDFSEKDEVIITGVRPSGEKVGVPGMSDGTRDQLYLALRVASLEKYLSTAEPVPFVVDDILIRFDDDRAMAALNVLAELSRKTQVLFLTHHARLVELVKKGTFAGEAEIHLLT